MARPAVPPAGPQSGDGSGPYAGWIAAARSAGHPVISVQPGRFRPDPLPLVFRAMPPGELLEAAQEYARAGVSWVHVEMPSLASMLALGPAIRGPRPAGPAVLAGGPGGIPWKALVASQHIGPRAIMWTEAGETVHVLDVPAAWLSCPIAKVGPPAGPPKHPAPEDTAPKDAA